MSRANVGLNNAILGKLLQNLPGLRTQMYFKSSLTALSHAMVDLVLAGVESPLIITNFQLERFFRSEHRRYEQLVQHTDQIYVMAVPDSKLDSKLDLASGISGSQNSWELISLDPKDSLAHERSLVIVGKCYFACLVGREQSTPVTYVDQMRRFEGFWSFDPQTTMKAAYLLLAGVERYQPELASKLEQARLDHGLALALSPENAGKASQDSEATIFGKRLVNHLQAGQYKLLKAYQAIAAQEERERLINKMSAAIRTSLDPQAILSTAVQELGQTFAHCRCVLYRCNSTDQQVLIQYEFVPLGLPSLQGQHWSLSDNPLIQVVLAQDRAITIADVKKVPSLHQAPGFNAQIKHWQIRSWLLVPIRYQGSLLGMIELHGIGAEPYVWQDNDLSLVEAISTQVGVALTQAEAYASLGLFNQQLEALERTQRNLIAIVGHELRTPLSTIQIFLESMATEPEMPAEFFQIMLDTALIDSERMRKLVLNFLTLSRLESGKSYGYPEAIQLEGLIQMAINSFESHTSTLTCPKICLQIPEGLPLVQADGEGLVEVLTKLLDNACKFTDSEGEIVIQARLYQENQDASRVDEIVRAHSVPMVEVVVADTGRGIEPSQLTTIFERFSQEEDYLQRSVSGVGLGLAICRQIVLGIGGQIWANSDGKNRGSQFHFTVPIALIKDVYQDLPGQLQETSVWC